MATQPSSAFGGGGKPRKTAGNGADRGGSARTGENVIPISPTGSSQDIHRAPPHSVEAEQGVLGSMLISPRDAIAECVEKITEEYFYVPAHQIIYRELVDLERQFPELIAPDSPTQRVGGKPREGFVKVEHSSPMLSLDNTYNEEELRNWERRVHELSGRKDVDYVCELKLDGMSLALVYEDGRLVRGVTRGDGTVGEDVTLNVRTVRSIPLVIPKEKLRKAAMPADFEVRGELLMPLAAFKRMNDEREGKGLSLFANPRNATAGTVRRAPSCS